MPFVRMPLAGNVDANSNFRMTTRAVAIADTTPVIATVFEKKKPPRRSERKHHMSLAIVAVPPRLNPEFQCAVGGIKIIVRTVKNLVSWLKPRAVRHHTSFIRNSRG